LFQWLKFASDSGSIAIALAIYIYDTIEEFNVDSQAQYSA